MDREREITGAIGWVHIATHAKNNNNPTPSIIDERDREREREREIANAR